jgi:hypothetical protein
VDATLEALEKETFYEDEPAQVPPTDIVAYNELRSCADLYRMHAQGILDLQPEFQRDFVWKGPDKTRFIDSLIKQLPIPSMCFAMDHKAQRWIVIDGLQRISTIVAFLDGTDWKLSPLPDIDQGLAGISAAAIKTSNAPLHQYYTRVENLSIPVTVLRCDFSKKNHMDYLFTIFHRLNTGGVKLNNQEIRNCIFGGALNTLLKELDLYGPWRRINKMKVGNSYRFTKQEIILRFLAFHDRMSAYEGNLAGFINDYMQEHRNGSPTFIERKRILFQRTVECISKKIFPESLPSKMSITLLEGLLVGVAKNIDALEVESAAKVRTRFTRMTQDPEYSETSLKEGLSKKPRVAARLSTAIRIFAEG